uniref:Uncharacterized protein n=1 Tax=Plectus sambesii TaxID=2011161 RepID=A0A914UTE3_9BILA
MQDRVPPHFAKDVRDLINEHVAEHWMGGSSPIMPWSSRSPDLTPCDFFLWGFIKSKVYTTKPRDTPELKDHVRNAFGQLTDEMRQMKLLEYRDRLEPIQKDEGVHIEQYNS